MYPERFAILVLLLAMLIVAVVSAKGAKRVAPAGHNAVPTADPDDGGMCLDMCSDICLDVCLDRDDLGDEGRSVEHRSADTIV